MKIKAEVSASWNQQQNIRYLFCCDYISHGLTFIVKILYPYFLNYVLCHVLGGGKWSASCPVVSPRYSLDRRLDGQKNGSGRGGEEKNPLPMLGIKPWLLHHAVHTLVTILTELELKKT
jgi:hypothetical protein